MSTLAGAARVRMPAAASRSAAAEAGAAVLAVRLGAFLVLAAFAAAHWASLVEDAPSWRVAAVVLVAAAGGALLALSARLPGPGPALAALRVLVALGTAFLAFVAIGLEARLLFPGGWRELGDGLDQGLAGLRTVEWPYHGDSDWVRQTILLGIPPLAALAGVLAFWPARRAGPVLRGAALVLLLVLYGVPVTERELGAELLRGVVLAGLIAAWLWPPRLRGSEAGLAAAAAVTAAIVAVPVAVALDGDEPWIHYRSWSWFGTISGTTFDWNHGYGPIDWPREGTTLLQVQAERPLYWKVQTLDRFDGLFWVHSRDNDDTTLTGELPNAALEPRWEEHDIRFTVRSFRSELVPVTGTPFSVRGLGPVYTTQDGTTTLLEETLRKGDSYTVDAYVPDPTAAQMRTAPPYWSAQYRKYTRVELPARGQTAIEGIGRTGDAARSAAPPPPVVLVPFRGEGFERAAANAALRRSPYAGTFRLAQRLAAGGATTYDVVKAVERHLAGEYRYNERPPSQEYPLEAFLFEDRSGYCQQFSGAMALMLRMLGIPARVAAGFSPGSYNRDSGEFRVRDLDAHSWVEVYFSGIGWVPFDPTPSGAPAASRSRAEEAESAARGDTDPGRGQGVAAERAEGADGAPPGGGAGDGGLSLWMLPLMLALVALTALGGVWLQAALAARGRDEAAGIEARVAELARALRRLGYAVPPGTTLLVLEGRLGRIAGETGARYARSLREHRYARRPCRLPGPGDRRALRRALARRGGLRGRLRALTALPPFRHT